MAETLHDCWRDYSLEPDTWAGWRVGPIEVCARPAEAEWRFAWRRSGDALSSEMQWRESTQVDEDGGYEFSRFVLDKPGCGLSLRPRLADRAVVYRLETALFVLPLEEASLFVASPVWLAFSTRRGKKGEKSLLEVPSWRPSDTWFGPDTTQGELSYASLTKARTSIEQLQPPPHRAITHIKIRNRGNDALLLSHLRLPVTMLSLYLAHDHRLWTDPVVFERPAEADSATFRIREKSRHLPEKMRHIGSPREELPRRRLVDTIGRLLQ